jgi:hypothetical protein
MIAKGYIIKTDGIYATVSTYQNQIFDDVLLIYPYGFQSKIKPTESTLILLFGALDSNSNLFGIAYDIITQSTLEEGEAEVRNRISNFGFLAGEDKNYIEGDVNINGNSNANSYKVNNIKVLGSQQPTISNPTGGSTIDAESRTAITSILNALKSHGIIAS